MRCLPGVMVQDQHRLRRAGGIGSTLTTARNKPSALRAKAIDDEFSSADDAGGVEVHNVNAEAGERVVEISKQRPAGHQIQACGATDAVDKNDANELVGDVRAELDIWRFGACGDADIVSGGCGSGPSSGSTPATWKPTAGLTYRGLFKLTMVT